MHLNAALCSSCSSPSVILALWSMSLLFNESAITSYRLFNNDCFPFQINPFNSFNSTIPFAQLNPIQQSTSLTSNSIDLLQLSQYSLTPFHLDTTPCTMPAQRRQSERQALRHQPYRACKGIRQSMPFYQANAVDKDDWMDFLEINTKPRDVFVLSTTCTCVHSEIFDYPHDDNCKAKATFRALRSDSTAEDNEEDLSSDSKSYEVFFPGLEPKDLKSDEHEHAIIEYESDVFHCSSNILPTLYRSKRLMCMRNLVVKILPKNNVAESHPFELEDLIVQLANNVAGRMTHLRVLLIEDYRPDPTKVLAASGFSGCWDPTFYRLFDFYTDREEKSTFKLKITRPLEPSHGELTADNYHHNYNIMLGEMAEQHDAIAKMEEERLDREY